MRRSTRPAFSKLVGADEAQRIVGFAGHGILAAFAAGEGEQRAAHAEAARKISEQGAVFVVGVGDDHHHAGSGGKPAEGLLQRGRAAVFGQGQRDAGGFGERSGGGQIAGGRLLRGREASGKQSGKGGEEDDAGRAKGADHG